MTLRSSLTTSRTTCSDVCLAGSRDQYAHQRVYRNVARSVLHSSAPAPRGLEAHAPMWSPSMKAASVTFCGKTDKAVRGEQVTVGRIGGPYCPVGRVEELLQCGYRTVPSIAQRPDPASATGRLRWEEVEDTGPLLRATNSGGDTLGQVAAPLSAPIPPLTWQQYSSELRRLCLAAGVRHLPTHAFRRGGATAAVAGGAPRDDVMKEGRWRTKRVFEFTYVQEIEAAACHVTACLGLAAGLHAARAASAAVAPAADAAPEAPPGRAPGRGRGRGRGGARRRSKSRGTSPPARGPRGRGRRAGGAAGGVAPSSRGPRGRGGGTPAAHAPAQPGPGITTRARARAAADT
ncbi:hypothetical protein HYH02_015344 [Chlamydomonas schloesseri]|uniref:Uncharacterized protein n=1 Tax=Chlamydomonas schloesseri TaxID=2026947 RepID=A0A835VRN4_9CHLO|nr:hypothetical protein HYH02_015344 [Chlamydomonas schloesseri]|eukprot:KAG2423328.1 hypothetical protein HYH02_015344 [Chlamydomonas schloesseri]